MRILITALLGLMLSSAAEASIELGNDATIIGNGNVAQDGFNLTIDTDTGLEWLDLTLSTNLSYDYVSTQFGVGGDFEGFRYANRAQVNELWRNAGISPIPNLNVMEDSSVITLVTKLGVTFSNINATRSEASGLYDDSIGGTDPGKYGWGFLLDDSNANEWVRTLDDFIVGNYAGPAFGSYLVRDTPEVPEPTTFVVWSLLALSAVNNRRKLNR